MEVPLNRRLNADACLGVIPLARNKSGHLILGGAGVPGDLYVVVHVLPDAQIQRDDADLWLQEDLPLPDAVLGTKLEVPTLEGGKAEVNVPAGTQPDTVLRLRNKGLPRFGGKGVGDMYLQLKLKVPEKLGHEERTLYERLRDLGGKPKRHFWE